MPWPPQALCRWVSEQSLHIYARMNETTYTYWLTRAMGTSIDSVRTTTLARDLPMLDDADLVHGLLQLNLTAVRE